VAEVASVVVIIPTPPATVNAPLEEELEAVVPANATVSGGVFVKVPYKSLYTILFPAPVSVFILNAPDEIFIAVVRVIAAPAVVGAADENISSLPYF